MSEATGEYPGSEEMLRRYPEYKLYVRGAGILPEEIYGRVRPDIAGTTLFRLILDVKTGNYLKKNNISTIEDLAAIEQRILARALGDEEVRTVTDKIKDLTRRLALFSPEDHLMSEVFGTQDVLIDPGLEPKRFEFIDKVINSIPRKGATKYWAWVAGIRFGLLDGQYRIIDDVARTTRFPATNVKHILGNFNTHMRLFENGALSQYLPGLRLVP